MIIGNKRTTMITSLLVLLSSVLWFFKFDSFDYSVLILVLSLIKYLFETALLGIVAIPIMQMFIKIKNSSDPHPYLLKIIQAAPIIQILISGSIYVSFPILIEFFAYRTGIPQWFLFPFILVSKLSFAICIAFMVLATKKRTNSNSSGLNS